MGPHQGLGSMGIKKSLWAPHLWKKIIPTPKPNHLPLDPSIQANQDDDKECSCCKYYYEEITGLVEYQNNFEFLVFLKILWGIFLEQINK